MNEIYRSYFKEGNYPARTTIEAPLAAPGMLLEIECVAEIP
jgi:2-iminobutanoate/2-iminopropanoate deaminase